MTSNRSPKAAVRFNLRQTSLTVEGSRCTLPMSHNQGRLINKISIIRLFKSKYSSCKNSNLAFRWKGNSKELLVIYWREVIRDQKISNNMMTWRKSYLMSIKKCRKKGMREVFQGWGHLTLGHNKSNSKFRTLSARNNNSKSSNLCRTQLKL